MKVEYNFNSEKFDDNILNYTKKYGFVIGKMYDIMGLCIFRKNKKYLEGRIHYLIKINNKIDWFPDFLFLETSLFDKLPFNWFIGMEENEKYSFLMGYYELVNDINHFEGLINNEEKDIKIFFDRYKEIKNWEKQLNYYSNEITFNDILSKIQF